MTLTAGAAKLNIVQAEMTGSPFSSFLPIQHDDGGGAPALRSSLLGRSNSQNRWRRVLPLLHSVHSKQPICLRPQARTGHGAANYHDRRPGGCSTAQGTAQEAIQAVFG